MFNLLYIVPSCCSTSTRTAQPLEPAPPRTQLAFSIVRFISHDSRHSDQESSTPIVGHVVGVEDCRTRASSRPPQTHISYKAVDGFGSRYKAHLLSLCTIQYWIPPREYLLQISRDTITAVSISPSYSCQNVLPTTF
jgi:hypothetical protein